MSISPEDLLALRNVASKCGNNPDYEYEYIYKKLRAPLIIVTYCTVGCLVTTLLFYIQRPKKDAEQLVIDKWWKRGVSAYAMRMH